MIENLKDFIDELKEYSDDLMDDEGDVSSHSFPTKIYVEDDQDIEYDIRV